MLLLELRRYFRARGLEWQGVAFLIGWGVMLLLPGPTFGRSPSYRDMGMVASEEAWGSAFLVSGVLRACALTVNGLWRPCAHIRAAFALMTAAMWFAVFLHLLWAGTQSTGVALYLVMATSEVIAASQAAGDAAELDKAALRRRQDEQRRREARQRGGHHGAAGGI